MVVMLQILFLLDFIAVIWFMNGLCSHKVMKFIQHFVKYKILVDCIDLLKVIVLQQHDQEENKSLTNCWNDVCVYMADNSTVLKKICIPLICAKLYNLFIELMRSSDQFKLLSLSSNKWYFRKQHLNQKHYNCFKYNVINNTVTYKNFHWFKCPFISTVRPLYVYWLTNMSFCPYLLHQKTNIV